jgi:hypothetical protein
VSRVQALLATLVAGTALAGLAQACGGGGSHEGTVAPGGDCEQATDCQEGYVCIPQTTGPKQCCGTQSLPSGQCANNLSSIQSSLEAGGGTDAPAAMNDAAAPTDGTAPNDGTMPMPETGGMETAPPMETGTKETAPPMETGSPETGGGGNDASGG